MGENQEKQGEATKSKRDSKDDTENWLLKINQQTKHDQGGTKIITKKHTVPKKYHKNTEVLPSLRGGCLLPNLAGNLREPISPCYEQNEQLMCGLPNH